MLQLRFPKRQRGALSGSSSSHHSNRTSGAGPPLPTHQNNENRRCIVYLQHHLRWEFVQIGDQERPAEDFRHTTFSVFRGTSKPRTTPDDADMALPPIYVGNKILHEVKEKSSCGVTSKYKLLGISQVMNFRTFSD
ncbi:hypothetical protein QWA68_012525 [Fusarium oxysporum]|nr:hypothetical protein QWA68_012525 [Fusarium oxysporum]